MKLYVMRHGETDWNLQRIVQGQTDIPLNETGKKQALDKKDEFNNLPIELIICSPLQRAKLTAKLVNSDKNIPIIFNDSLKERYMGDFEGKSIDKLIESGDYDKMNSIPRYKNVESIDEMCDRLHAFLDEIKGYNKNILLVTHGAAARVIELYFRSSRDYTLSLPKYGNCEIREYTW